jgi:hypothetical protein
LVVPTRQVAYQRFSSEIAAHSWRGDEMRGSRWYKKTQPIPDCVILTQSIAPASQYVVGNFTRRCTNSWLSVEVRFLLPAQVKETNLITAETQSSQRKDQDFPD